MIGRTLGPFLDWYAGQRRRQIERAWQNAAAVQTHTLLRLVETARRTEFGMIHGFDRIRTVADYQARVPVGTYLDFQPMWTRVLQGESDVTWPGRARHWVKTSGTTAGDKVIPVTREAFVSHRKGGWDAFLLAVRRVGARHLLDGRMLLVGGSTALHPVGRDGLLGDLSGLVVKGLPPVFRGRHSPGPTVAAIEDRETRMSAVAALVARQDLRLLSGMPSWVLILLEHVARVLEMSGRLVQDLGDCWPNLGVFVHGGVSFAPYEALFRERIGRPLDQIEVYPASEGFVAVETERGQGLTLMLDYGIFYEFVPAEDLQRPRPRRHTVADVELGRIYAPILTTPAGLWSYLLGDTVRFVARDPLRLQITGRTRHYVNAFGENVIVEEVERALIEACRRTEAEVVEFTVAPRYPAVADARGGHEWLVEFRRRPADLAAFARLLDEDLIALNTDYRTKRDGSVGMRPPRLTELPPGTFYEWMRRAGKLGDQHKVPRVTNDRAVADALARTAAAPTREPVLAGSRENGGPW
jgi:GH3 auxin-responsive promoter